MIFNLTEIVKNYDGTDVMQGEGDKARPLTFKDMLNQCVNTTLPSTSVEDKVQAFFVTSKAFANPEACDYKAEDIAFILRKVKEYGLPLGIGRAMEFFDRPAAKDPAADETKN